MNKIQFFKNNNIIVFDSSTINFIEEELKIIRETNEIILVLNYINNSCQFTLKNENITLDIKVIDMHYIFDNNTYIFNYVLETEPEIKNTIKIEKQDA